MKCPNCQRDMVLLFFSAVCDHCDSNKPKGETNIGYIVYRDFRPVGSTEYVFKTLEDCTKWRAAAGMTDYPIRAVQSPKPFRWRRSTGSVRDIELADRLHQVYKRPDLVPKDLDADEARVFLEPE